MADGFLGKGFSFLVYINDRGGVNLLSDEEKIKESIMIILSTAKGERVMRPSFGCSIHDFVFSVINSSTITQIKSAVYDALIYWEPRIEVLDVKTFDERVSEGILLIQVEYRVRQTNSVFNLVYPFYLEI